MSCARRSTTASTPWLFSSEVLRLADAIDPLHRAFVLLAAFGSLRWGELTGLRKSDFDLRLGLVRWKRSALLVGARRVVKRPKAAAGVRAVALPMRCARAGHALRDLLGACG